MLSRKLIHRGHFHMVKKDWDRKGKIQSMVVSAAVFSDHTVYGPDIILQTFLCAYKQFSGSVCRRQDVFYERNKGRAGTLWPSV